MLPSLVLAAPVAPVQAPHLLTLSPPPRKVNPDASTSPNRVPWGLCFCFTATRAATLRCDEVSRIARERIDERLCGLWGSGKLCLVQGCDSVP